VVGRTYGWLMLHRRLARDYETLPARSEAVIHIAMTDLMARRLTGESRVPAVDAVTELVRFVLAPWPVGDRYRILVRLAPQDLGAERVAEVLAPARDMGEAIISRGQRQGLFQTSVPPAVLTRALEGHLLGLLDCVNGGAWSDDGTGTATAALIAMGVNPGHAATRVRELVRPQGDGTWAPSRSITRGGEPCTSPSTTRSTSASPTTPMAPCM
jgi:hypothetical protein